MATQAEYDALQDAERRLIREQAGLPGRIGEAQTQITRLQYEGRLEDDVEVQNARAELDSLRARADALPDELLQTRRERLDALATLLPATDIRRRQAIADFRETARKSGVEALNPARGSGDLKRYGLDVPA